MLVEILRNQQVESRHKVQAHIVNARGEILFKTSESFLFFPRSAVKPFQAHLLLESGAFKAFNLTLEHLAVACASHGGEKIHTDLVSAWLKNIKHTPEDLRCGTHWPNDLLTSDQMKADHQKPTNLHNNCSGKHTGMLSVCVHCDIPAKDYHLPEHPIQQQLKSLMEKLIEDDLKIFGVDGCSLPAFEMDFHKVCLALARMAKKAKEDSSSSAGMIFKAFQKFPLLTAGHQVYSYQLMAANQGKIISKEGAEGVLIAAIPSKEIAILVKAQDGAKRAASAAMDHLVQKFGDCKPVFDSEIRNWAGILTGNIRVQDAQ